MLKPPSKRRARFNDSVAQPEIYNNGYNTPETNNLIGTDNLGRALKQSFKGNEGVAGESNDEKAEYAANVIPGFDDLETQQVVNDTSYTTIVASNNTEWQKKQSFRIDPLPSRIIPVSAKYHTKIRLRKNPSGDKISDDDRDRLALVPLFIHALFKSVKLSVDGESMHFNNASDSIYERGMLTSLRTKESFYKLFEEDYCLTPWEGGLTVENQKRRVKARQTDQNVGTSTQLTKRINSELVKKLCTDDGLSICFPLSWIEFFFTSSSMASNRTVINLDLFLEDDPTRLLETTKGINAGDKPYKLEVKSHPKIVILSASATDQWTGAVSMGFAHKSNSMTMTQSYDIKKNVWHEGSGLVNISKKLDQPHAQPSWLILYLQLTDNFNHTSMHDNRAQLCTSLIQRVKILRVSPGGDEKDPFNLDYDLGNEISKEELYSNYLSFLEDECSFIPNDKRDLNDLKYIQKKSEYFAASNSKMMLFIDLRQDKGYAGMLNPAINGLDPMVELELKSATIAATSFCVLSVYPASMALVSSAPNHEYKYNPGVLKA